ncbi:hypothetical protein ACFE04_029187 [Oxalis oulophora]
MSTSRDSSNSNPKKIDGYQELDGLAAPPPAPPPLPISGGGHDCSYVIVSCTNVLLTEVSSEEQGRSRELKVMGPSQPPALGVGHDHPEDHEDAVQGAEAALLRIHRGGGGGGGSPPNVGPGEGAPMA